MMQVADMGTKQQCEWCGKAHTAIVCPLVVAVEYFPNGGIKRVEFKARGSGPDYRPTPITGMVVR